MRRSNKEWGMALSRVMFFFFVTLAAVTAVGGSVLWWQVGVSMRQEAASSPGPGIIAGTPAIGGPFTLIDHTGREVNEATFRGKYLLIVFGFTQCPDVCPLALARFAQVLELLGPDAAQVQPLMISVDPERDTPEVLEGFVTAFHPRLIGLTGSLEQVKAAAAAYRVYFDKAGTGSAGGYAVNHSTFEYFMGPDGRNRYVFTVDAEPERMAEAIRTVIRQ